MTTVEELKDIEQLKFNLENELNEAQSARELALEDKRQKFREKEIGYTEAGQHLRSLNQFMWQVPGITIAVTGGLWYGVSLWENSDTKIFALWFLAAFDFLMIFVLLRMRGVLERYIELQKNSDFEKQPARTTASGRTIWSYLFAWTKWKYLVVGIWSLLLALAGGLSVIGAIHPERLTSMKLGTGQVVPLTIEVVGNCSDKAAHAETLPTPASSVIAIGGNFPVHVRHTSRPCLPASSVNEAPLSAEAAKTAK